jgi:ATP-dependent exoDNAse (exonuclease V) alpha subunit
MENEEKENIVFSGTIHSFLGFKIVDSYEQKILEKRKDFKVTRCDVLIVDEYSMLTKELVKEIQHFIQEGYVGKAILVGDKNQLILSDYIKAIKLPVYTLTKQMRQVHGSTLHSFLENINEQIEQKRYEQNNIFESADVIRYDSHKSFIEAYKSCKSEKIILAFQNQTVKHYNKNILKYIHKKESEYNLNDVLVMREPYLSVIKNNEKVRVVNIEEFEFWYELEVVCRKGNVVFKTSKTSSWLKEWLDVYASKKDWKGYYKLKEQFASVHHCYALTTHKSQGSTYEEVFVDVTDMLKCEDIDDIFRLMYVGMSRAKKKVHLFVGDKRDYKAFE